MVTKIHPYTRKDNVIFFYGVRWLLHTPSERTLQSPRTEVYAVGIPESPRFETWITGVGSYFFKNTPDDHATFTIDEVAKFLW